MVSRFLDPADWRQEYEKQENARRTCPTGLREDEVQILKIGGKEDRGSTTAGIFTCLVVEKMSFIFHGILDSIFGGSKQKYNNPILKRYHCVHLSIPNPTLLPRNHVPTQVIMQPCSFSHLVATPSSDEGILSPQPKRS